MTLGQRIQELRKRKGLSQESLGASLGVSRQAVSKWEGDNGIPELNTIIAMSHLFGVTVGQLLGVEEPTSSETENNRTIDEEKLESILSQYAEKVSSGQRISSWLTRWGWDLSAVIIAVTVAIVLFVQNNSLRSTVRLLQRDVSNLQMQVSENQSNLSGQIRDTIYDVLAEEAKLLNKFEWKLVDFDLENQTAAVQLTATMKEYHAGSKLQFSANWRKVDDSEGCTNSEWVEGPDFCTVVTLPLNYHTEISIRVENADGDIQEQSVDTISRLHPENFCLYTADLMRPFAVTIKSFGTLYTTAKTQRAFITIHSSFPKFIWPEEAVITAYINDEEVYTEAMTIAPNTNNSDEFLVSMKDIYCDLTLKEGDTLKIVLVVTDNLGRIEQFVDGGIVVDGSLERQEGAAPVDFS
ncbi:MAG: helix-turn-helix transcriptional regulator [Oscillospiraceae bacterium]|nr:helix-turn-helix transcriptional regulator [Oscillospiraceae bacterium]